MKDIAVIGGGGTAIMMATDLTLKGHRVVLCDQEWHSKKLKALMEHGNEVHMTGANGTGTATISKITLDVEEALAGAEVVLISAMALRHESVTDWISPYLHNGQTVIFSAGNCGSFLLKKKLGGKNILVGEMQGNIYPCRLIETNVVTTAFSYKEKGVAAFPGKDTPALVEALSPVYPCHGVKNIFEATLNSPNVSIHLAGTIMGLAKLETTEDFRLYRDGLSPSVEKIIGAVEAEKAAVMDKIGYTCARAVGQITNLMAYDRFPELDAFRQLAGPFSAHDRYIVEDAHAGNSLLLSLARANDVETPLLAGLITMASVLNDRDFYKNGITLENLGLVGKTMPEIDAYLETGIL